MNVAADITELPVRIEQEPDGAYVLIDDQGRPRARVLDEKDAALFAAALVHVTVSVQPGSIVLEIPFRVEPRDRHNIYCPDCGRHIRAAKVLDSRQVADDKGGIRRKRECRCGCRFTTYEYVDAKTKRKL